VTPGPAVDALAFPEKRPVVAARPVLVIPFEEGYRAGFERGEKDAHPRSKSPAAAEVDALASEAAGTDPKRNEKWRSGWSQGYQDGFRQRATKSK